MALDTLVSKHKIIWYWIRGHTGYEGNEKCDQLATEEIAKLLNK